MCRDSASIVKLYKWYTMLWNEKDIKITTISRGWLTNCLLICAGGNRWLIWSITWWHRCLKYIHFVLPHPIPLHRILSDPVSSYARSFIQLIVDSFFIQICLLLVACLSIRPSVVVCCCRQSFDKLVNSTHRLVVGLGGCLLPANVAALERWWVFFIHFLFHFVVFLFSFLLVKRSKNFVKDMLSTKKKKFYSSILVFFF